MAKKKQQNLLHDPPTASSSDDDEVEHSEEDSLSDEEAIKTLPKVPSASDGKSASDSDSGSDAENESDDSDSETTNPYKSGKTVPVAASSVSLPPEKSGTKRPASEGTPSKEDNSTKRAKRKVITSREGGSVKSPAFQRKWTEEDEISLLGGMIDFKSDTGKSPYDDTNGFYESIKKSFSFEVSKNQFMEKIRSLKKKFFSNEVNNGGKPSFAKAHDLNIYKLSKQIWGADGIALVSNIKSSDVSKKSQSKKKLDIKQELVSVASPNGKMSDASPNGKMSDASPNGKKVEDDGKVEIHRRSLGKSDWFAESFLVRSIAAYGVDENFVKQKWTLISIEEKKKIEEKWKQLQAKEFQFVLEKTDFVHAVTTMIVEASKNKPSDI